MIRTITIGAYISVQGYFDGYNPKSGLARVCVGQKVYEGRLV